MRWKWREAMLKWLLGSCCDDYKPSIAEWKRASCIIPKHIAYSHVETAIWSGLPFVL